MTTSIGQYVPVFLPGEPPDREAWEATVYRVAKSRTLLKQARARRHETSFACDSSASVRIEHEGGAAAWLAGTLVAPSVQEHGLPPSQELWPYRSLFSSLFLLAIRRPLWPVFVARPIQALRGLPRLGSLFVDRCVRHLKGPPWLGSY